MGMDYAPDTTFREIGGLEELIEDVRRGLTTPAGALWWAPGASVDLGSMLNATMGTDEERRLEAACEAVFQGDPTKTVRVAVRRGEATVRAESDLGSFTSVLRLDEGRLVMEVTRS